MKTSLALSALVVLVTSASVSSYLSLDDRNRLSVLFTSAVPFKDAVTAYWSLKGLSTLNSLPKDANSICQGLKSLPADTAESIYSLTEAAALIKCTLPSNAAYEAALTAALKEKKVSSLFHAYNAMKNLKLKVDNAQVNTDLDTALKTDDSPTSNGYAFLLTTALGLDTDKRYQLIEDVFAQADVVDNKYMQFEGGIFTTSLVIESSYKLASKAKKAPTLTNDQVQQLANYLLSRKHVSKIRSAAQLLTALTTLSTNEFHVPVSISLDKLASVSATNKKIAVRVGTVMGDSLGKMTLTADSGRHIADDAVVLSKKTLTATSDPAVFELDFTNIKAPFGFYRVQLTAAPAKPDNKLVGLKGAVEFKVVTAVTIDAVDLGVSDKDASNPKAERISYPDTSAQLSADTHQKLTMKFNVKSSSSGETMKAHQVFVRMTHKETQQEITFVATSEEGSNRYTFELDVGANEKDFASLSGVYDMSLLVGDAVIDNPITWSVCPVQLTFLGKYSADNSADQYKPRPTITHMFREPEKRPAAVVSNVFTILCLSPLLIMLALWIKLGVNVSNLPASLSAIGFHVGLAGIFMLYYMYWTHLNMFDTIKYLSVLGVPTFLFGNQLLCTIAARRKSK